MTGMYKLILERERERERERKRERRKRELTWIHHYYLGGGLVICVITEDF